MWGILSFFLSDSYLFKLETPSFLSFLPSFWIMWEVFRLRRHSHDCTLSLRFLFFSSLSLVRFNNLWSHWVHNSGFFPFCALQMKSRLCPATENPSGVYIKKETFVHDYYYYIFFPGAEESQCKMWRSLRAGLFLMDDIHFSMRIVSVLSGPVALV